MQKDSPTENPGRFLFAAGTAEYQHFEQFPNLLIVKEELDTIVRLFEALGYGCANGKPLLNPTSSELKLSLKQWFRNSSLSKNDLVVIYYSGHGIIHTNPEKHYLITSDSNQNELYDTALASSELPELLWLAGALGTVQNLPKQVLVILDVCYAGYGTNEMLSAAALMSNRFKAAGQNEVTLYCIACAGPREPAKPEHFPAALKAAVDNSKHGGVHQQFLHPDELLSSVNDYFKVQKLLQEARGNLLNSLGLSTFFPNPRFNPKIPIGLDLEGQRRADWISHWSPKGRGVEVECEPGYYFTGRVTVLQALVSWLTSEEPDCRARIVTGGPGSGKSAVLARLVMLSQRQDVSEEKELIIVPSGLVDLAIHVRGKSLNEVITQIAQSTSIQANSSEDLIYALAKKDCKLVIVVDALDEALETDRIARLIGQIADNLPKVRMIAGCRSSVLKDIPQHTRIVIDLDDPFYFNAIDMAQYIRRRLLEEPESPYNRKNELAETVAEAVAQRADKSFLVAQIISRTLTRSGEALDPNLEGWYELIPVDIESAFRADLARFGDHQERIRDLLEPLAYSEGRGIPWENLWADLATEISGRSESNRYTDSDIRYLIDRAGYYIIEDRENDFSVYRLYHQEFARFLRNERREQDIQKKIANTLIQKISVLPDGSKNWSSSLPYIRTHLASHAAHAGLLDNLLLDPLFLVEAQSERLLRQLHKAQSESARAAAKVYRLTVRHLQTKPRKDHLSYFDLVARKYGADDLIKDIDWQSKPWLWRTLWAKWQPSSSSRIVAQHSDWIKSLEVTQLKDARTIVISASSDGLKVTHLESGKLLWQCQENGVKSIATSEFSGEVVVLAGCEDGNVRIFNLKDGQQVGKPFGGHTEGRPGYPHIRAIIVGFMNDELPVAITGGNDGTMRIWDLNKQELIGEPIQVSEDPIHDMVVGKLDNKLIVVVSTTSSLGERFLKVYDLAEQALMRQYSTGEGISWSLGLAERQGKTVIVSGDSDDTVRVIDLDSGEQLISRKLIEGSQGVVTVNANNKQVCIVSSRHLIGVWNLETDDWKILFGLDLNNQVTALTISRLHNQTVVISGSMDCGVRIWDVEDAQIEYISLNDVVYTSFWNYNLGEVYCVQIGKHQEQELVVAGSVGPSVSIWNLNTGEGMRLSDLFNAEEKQKFYPTYFSLNITQHHGHLAIAVGGAQIAPIAVASELEIPNNYKFIKQIISNSKNYGFTLAFGKIQDLTLLAISDSPGTVCIYRLDNFSLLRKQVIPFNKNFLDKLVFTEWEGKIFLVSLDRESKIHIWRFEPHTFGCLQMIPVVAPKFKVETINIGEIGNQQVIVAGGEDSKLCLWNLIDGQMIGTPFEVNAKFDKQSTVQSAMRTINAVVISKINNQPVIIVGGDDRVLRLLHPNGRLLSEIELDARIHDLSEGSNGEIAIASSMGLIVLKFNIA